MIQFLYAILILSVALYLLINVLLHIGLSRKYPRTKIIPKVTILVAARDEQETIAGCLESLSKLSYPTDQLEIYILDDNSSDQTRVIAQIYCQRSAHIRLIEITENRFGLQGKMNALAQGIEHSHGEIILITDADCVVPPDWVTEYVSYFSDDVGLVGGMTLLTMENMNEPLHHHVQTMDWLYLQSVASGTAGIGRPISILGNNFAFRKKAYNAVGGFSSIGFSLTEDMALLRAIEEKTEWKTAYPLGKSTAIYSRPLDTLNELLQQRRRWSKGGIKTSIWGFTLLSVSFLAHITALLPFLWGLWTYPLYAFLLLFCADFLIIFRILKRFNLGWLIYIFPAFELYYILYTIILALMLPLPLKVVWKGRTYRG
jgi:cellulose synthase/poly-beta-1,6-N-acetylglucosamine synthase-like glycosyltransferase